MEVLSCSDVKYVGDTNCTQKHSGVKSSEDIHGDTHASLLPLDYCHQRSGDELSVSDNNGDRTSVIVDCAQEMPSHDQLNGQQGPRVEVPNGGAFPIVGTSQLVNGPSICVGDELFNDSYGIKDGTKRVDSSDLNGCSVSNRSYDKGDSFSKVDDIRKIGDGKDGRSSLLTSSNVLCSQNYSCLNQEQTRMADNTCRVSECLVPAGDIGREDVLTKSESICRQASNPQHGESEMCSGFREAYDSLPIVKYSGNSDNLLPNAKQGEVFLVECDYLEEDVTAALWVKWRGKWQPGIHCSRADWPLSTVKARPTHGRKKYIVVFFPYSRIHCWADKLLVCSINERPEPLAAGTHASGMEMVKDLSIPRRYIMQKLAVAMLNVSDQLHTASVIESARRVTAWKEFALEAHQCEQYSDLGRMLLKLHTMILPTFIDANWLKHSFTGWRQRCIEAQNAESVETLIEELVDSVLWNEVDALWDAAPFQPDSGSEWKTWKQEVMKWFSMSHPQSGVEDTDQRYSDELLAASAQTSSRKRQKLEVRRSEVHPYQVEANTDEAFSQPNGVETDAQFFSSRSLEMTTPVSGSSKESSFTGVDAPVDDPGAATDGWYDIVVVEAANPEFLRTIESGSAADGGSGVKPMVDGQPGARSETKYRQCMAFIEAKGRQCGRWANDGDIYCCVHLSHRFVDGTSKVEQTPPPTDLCEGMTNHGARCKHRSQSGSSFCKKHQLHARQNLVDAEVPLVSSENELKRKFEQISSSETISGKERVLVGEDQTAHVDSISPPMVEEASDGRNSLMEISDVSGVSSTLRNQVQETKCCIVRCPLTNEQCEDKGKLHTLYCEKHLPAWLKRARHGKTRIISKEVFTDLLRRSNSRKQKVQLHQACELLYRFMKSALSRRNTVSKETLIGWILSEASNDVSIVEYLLEVVSREREKIGRLWGFIVDKNANIASLSVEPRTTPEASKNSLSAQTTIKCKICMEEYIDDSALGAHWMEAHKREAQWLFRGFACAICSNSFTNRKVLETHVKERHSRQSLDECILFQCMPCGSHFVNPDDLWLHVRMHHSTDFRLPTVSQLRTNSVNQGAEPKSFVGNKPPQSSDGIEKNPCRADDSRRFTCKLCGLKFDLLPDLGRHHQVAHMGPNSHGHFLKKRSHIGKLKPGRPGRPRLKKVLDEGSAIKILNHASLKDSVSSTGLRLQNQSHETKALEQCVESHCSGVAKILFPELRKTKSRPSNVEILSIARSTCCKVNLHSALEAKYGVLPERLYLKAAKLCSELNVRVEWHLDEFVCPRGCKPFHRSYPLATLLPHSDRVTEPPLALLTDTLNGEEWEMEECHYVLNSKHFKQKHMKKIIVLCNDLSFGREAVPVPCVVDEDLRISINNSMDGNSNPISSGCSVPWESFTYVTERLLDPSLDLHTKCLQLGCACMHPTCYPELCDHVYLFNNDFENAIDINGNPMNGKFPYDDDGRIILQEGFLVYECNSMCSCERSCRNRVLQRGMQVKLEVFKSQKKGWAVRAGEAIPCGTFICEYIGEVLSNQEAAKRGERCKDGCSYLYDINANFEDVNALNEASLPYVIDATKYGNVSRFINHSCSPNLAVYQVLVESMDCQLAHIGFFASRNIAVGEELAYNYRFQLPLQRECPCYCGASNCRGRLY